jgi:hypothetical protein
MKNPDQHSAFSKHFKNLCRVAPAVVGTALLLSGTVAWAQNARRASPGSIQLVNTVPIPGTGSNTTNGSMYVFDISYVDETSATPMYYLADRSNAVIDVVDATNDVLVARIAATPPFAGFTGNNSTSGPNGVIAGFPWLFASDANSRVVSINLNTHATVSSISTGGAPGLRADEMAYDQADGLLLAVNNADTPPFATLIAVNGVNGGLVPLQKITLDAAHGIDAQNGAEQPVWDPGTGKFYLSIPQIGSNVANGGVVRISKTGVPETIYPIQFCGPAGLTLGPKETLFVGCNTVFDTTGNVWNPTGQTTSAQQDIVLDATTGQILANVPFIGAGDEVWFNSGDGNFYGTGSGSPYRPTSAGTLTAQGATPFGVVSSSTHQLLQLVTSINVPAVTTGTLQHPAGTSHSIAANSKNNQIFVPMPANNMIPGCITGCIGVYSAAE